MGMGGMSMNGMMGGQGHFVSYERLTKRERIFRV